MMKRIIPVAMLALVPLSMFAAERMVMAELFTSTTCPPCVAGNANLTNILSTREDYLAVLRWHVWWPSSGDPFYHHDEPMNQWHVAKYSINSVPNLVVDGTNVGSVSPMQIDTRKDIASPFVMNLYRDYTPVGGDSAAFFGQGTGTLKLEITNEEGDKTFTLFGAITESKVEYTGSNGDPEHHQAVFEMITPTAGTEMTIEEGETVFLDFEFDIRDTIKDLPEIFVHPVEDSNVEIVFYAQDMAAPNKEVLQACKVKVTGQKDFSMSDIACVDASGDGILGPSEQGEVQVTVTNDAEEAIYDVNLCLEVDNEEVMVTKGKTTIDSIGPGESYTVTGEEALGIETSEDYDGSTFNFTVFAGSGDGSMASCEQPLAVEEGSVTWAPFCLTVPSVASGDCVLRLSLDSPQDVSLEVIDASGRVVQSLETSGLVRGLNLVTLETGELTNGVYFIRAATPAHRVVERLVVLN